eukprot:CAMPEP_0119125454 /NCGR_PEP_ID=MMETSP1310-20130426/4722_1 /TAXON_ID=464262 /ORGANISM="Genus nov. species nov., Strain RCC2339" /LENGTH=186 /DNA_ID=CAMNT_0007115525 /DNA_START=121 /DNA_END=681 /DNA_ORIENTATION=+
MDPLMEEKKEEVGGGEEEREETVKEKEEMGEKEEMIEKEKGKEEEIDFLTQMNAIANDAGYAFQSFVDTTLGNQPRPPPQRPVGKDGEEVDLTLKPAELGEERVNDALVTIFNKAGEAVTDAYYYVIGDTEKVVKKLSENEREGEGESERERKSGGGGGEEEGYTLMKEEEEEKEDVEEMMVGENE